MSMRWDRESIRFMRDACENSAYYPELAAWIAERLSPDSYVCDAGCGLGYLAAELAKTARRVTAVDKSAQALSVLEEMRAKRCADNVDVLCGRIEDSLPETTYDAMVFCFFGEGHDVLRIARMQCRRDVFMVLRNYPAHRFSVGHHPMEYTGYQEICRLLKELKIPFEREEKTLELGQPFQNMADAHAFFRLYSRDDEGMITDCFLKERLIQTGRKDFPYYMPHSRRIGLVHFRVENIPPV